MDVAEHLDPESAAAAYADLVGPPGGAHDLYAWGPWRTLVGRPVTDVAAGNAEPVAATITAPAGAPTYDPWDVQVRLTDSSGRLAATLPLPIDLRKQLPGSKTYLPTVTAPAGLPTGTYTVSVAVVDPTGYLAPMALANTSRLSDGSYRLGRVGVARSGITTSRRG